ncbi:9073_t:CDS:2 [Acaulospora morrowiae]|uniref:9073_t:CDS:1 n=1 Tax=Acaulospora morrowiae TaxID=94023 RepID=A0A9N8W6B2_9GLOM|nr:9073_t:CDS:2 [Acaulospora morrowiae]
MYSRFKGEEGVLEGLKDVDGVTKAKRNTGVVTPKNPSNLLIAKESTLPSLTPQESSASFLRNFHHQ